MKHGKISVSSPIARALIGKGEGDTAEVQAPGGVREYEVLAVRYAEAGVAPQRRRRRRSGSRSRPRLLIGQRALRRRRAPDGSDAARRGLAVRRRRRGATPACCPCRRPPARRARRRLAPWITLRRGAVRFAPRGGRARARRSASCAVPGFPATAAVVSAASRAFRSGGRGRRATGSGSGGGAGRQSVRTLPRCCTGAASSSAQIRASSASRSSRSSLNTRILMSSCASSVTSISCSTAGVRPCWPIATTGCSGCALARSARRSAGVRVRIAAFYATPSAIARAAMATRMATSHRRRTSSSRRGWTSTSTTRGSRKRTRLGYRSRAAFKLIELADKDKLLRPGMSVVDLGAAPGSWTQVLRERAGADGARSSRSISCRWTPIAGVTFVQADFREDEGLASARKALGGHKVDLVVSDMSPNLSGVEAADQARVGASWRAGARIRHRHGCNPAAISSSKRSRARDSSELRRAMEAHFAKVYVRKPKASRDRSREVYLVGKGLRKPEYRPADSARIVANGRHASWHETRCDSPAKG